MEEQKKNVRKRNVRLLPVSLVLLFVVARQLESRDDVHGLQLLKEQLASVGDAQRRHVTRRLAVVTPVGGWGATE